MLLVLLRISAIRKLEPGLRLEFIIQGLGLEC